jgi:hypothetical protein
MTVPVNPPAGWYPNDRSPGLLRWFDGAAWTEHTQPVPPAPPSFPQPVAVQYPYATSPYPAGGVGGPVFAGGPFTQPESLGSSPSDPVHWLLPVGRSWQSIVAGYVGLVALGVWALGPVAIGLGIWAIVRAKQGGHGRGRAVFAIIAGSIGSIFGLMFVSGAMSG